MKFCINCLWYKRVEPIKDVFYGSGFINVFKTFGKRLCGYNCTDAITGKLMEEKECYKERSINGKCGPDGKNWEEKLSDEEITILLDD